MESVKSSQIKGQIRPSETEFQKVIGLCPSLCHTSTHTGPYWGVGCPGGDSNLSRAAPKHPLLQCLQIKHTDRLAFAYHMIQDKPYVCKHSLREIKEIKERARPFYSPWVRRPQLKAAFVHVCFINNNWWKNNSTPRRGHQKGYSNYYFSSQCPTLIHVQALEGVWSLQAYA